MFLIIKTCNKIDIITLQYYGESVDEVQDEITTPKNPVTYTMVVEKQYILVGKPQRKPWHWENPHG